MQWNGQNMWEENELGKGETHRIPNELISIRFKWIKSHLNMFRNKTKTKKIYERKRDVDEEEKRRRNETKRIEAKWMWTYRNLTSDPTRYATELYFVFIYFVCVWIGYSILFYWSDYYHLAFELHKLAAKNALSMREIIHWNQNKNSNHQTQKQSKKPKFPLLQFMFWNSKIHQHHHHYTTDTYTNQPYDFFFLFVSCPLHPFKNFHMFIYIHKCI